MLSPSEKKLIGELSFLPAPITVGIGMTLTNPIEIKIQWIPFAKENPPKGKQGEKKYIFALVKDVPVVMTYWNEQFEPSIGMTHWFPIPDMP